MVDRRSDACHRATVLYPQIHRSGASCTSATNSCRHSWTRHCPRRSPPLSRPSPVPSPRCGSGWSNRRRSAVVPQLLTATTTARDGSSSGPAPACAASHCRRRRWTTPRYPPRRTRSPSSGYVELRRSGFVFLARGDPALHSLSSQESVVVGEWGCATCSHRSVMRHRGRVMLGFIATVCVTTVQVWSAPAARRTQAARPVEDQESCRLAAVQVTRTDSVRGDPTF